MIYEKYMHDAKYVISVIFSLRFYETVSNMQYDLTK